MKKLLVLLLVVTCVCVLLVGCGEKPIDAAGDAVQENNDMLADLDENLTDALGEFGNSIQDALDSLQ